MPLHRACANKRYQVSGILTVYIHAHTAMVEAHRPLCLSAFFTIHMSVHRHHRPLNIAGTLQAIDFARTGLSSGTELGYGYYGRVSKGLAVGLPGLPATNTEVLACFLAELNDKGKVG
jgi:hypothetical protein